ncbi:MAG: hypothetical protein ACTHK5_12725 [Tsuneonella sp.]
MTIRKLAAPLLASILALGLSACASTAGKYPSLAIRDAERVQGTFEPDAAPPPQPAPPPPSAALVSRLAELVDQASRAHRAFTAAVPGAQRAVAAAGGTGSDSWASAQVALADLDASRSKAAVPLGELDTLFIDATLAAENRDAIAAARDQVIAMIGDEDAALARLRGRL